MLILNPLKILKKGRPKKLFTKILFRDMKFFLNTSVTTYKKIFAYNFFC